MTQNNIIIPNAFWANTQYALHTDNNEVLKVGIHDSQLFSLLNNLKNGYSEEQTIQLINIWKIPIIQLKANFYSPWSSTAMTAPKLLSNAQFFTSDLNTCNFW